MSLDFATLYNLARDFSNSTYGNSEEPLSVSRIQRSVLAAALNGQFLVAFEYPKAVAQALAVEQQGNTPDFDPKVLSYYKTATQAVVTAFSGSPFTLSGLQDAAGFKVSWSGAVLPPPATPAAADTPVDTSADNVN
jgi:hypothetical protein